MPIFWQKLSDCYGNRLLQWLTSCWPRCVHITSQFSQNIDTIWDILLYSCKGECPPKCYIIVLCNPWHPRVGSALPKKLPLLAVPNGLWLLLEASIQFCQKDSFVVSLGKLCSGLNLRERKTNIGRFQSCQNPFSWIYCWNTAEFFFPFLQYSLRFHRPVRKFELPTSLGLFYPRLVRSLNFRPVQGYFVKRSVFN